MPIPDDVYFGPKPGSEDGGIHYGEVRKEVDDGADDNRKLHLLKARLDRLLIKQIASVSLLNEKGNNEKWAPFPLQILSFLAIETLGFVIGDFKKVKKENQNNYVKLLSQPVYILLDEKLSRPPSKKEKIAFKEQLELKEKPDSYFEIFHSYMRNSFNHGYQAKGVFVDDACESIWEVYDQGFLRVNPFRFWNRFVEVYEETFKEIFDTESEKHLIALMLYYILNI